jgi:large subunit ribosomal protein L22
MTGPKTNEGATQVGERVGTRAVAKYVRVSAYKARAVLDLIRGLDVKSADEVLRFTERDVAMVVRKCLASAVANAQNNDEQDPDELKVVACFADEGPTLRRFSPRARGRATRIRKRTCHITVIVGRMSPAELTRLEAKGGGRGAAAATASRRARVERSRQRAAAAKGGPAPSAAGATASQEAATTEVVDAEIVETGIVETGAAAAGAAEGPYGPGSAAPLADGSAPEGYDIKGNADSMLYHVPGSRHYKQTKAEVYFASTEAAEAAGFAAPGSTDDEGEEN